MLNTHTFSSSVGFSVFLVSKLMKDKNVALVFV